MTSHTDITDMVRRIARNERAAWQEIYRSAGTELVASLGIGYAEEHGALRIWNRAAPVALFNRVIGLGLFEEAGDDVLDQLLANVQTTKTRAQIQVTPGVRPADLAKQLAARGLERAPSWLVHTRTLDAATPEIAIPGYSIERVTTANAAAWSDTMLTAWDFPAWAATGVLAVTLPLVQNPAFVCLAAVHLASGQIAAGGMLFAAEGVAGLYADCVRPEHRRHNLHDALIAARLNEALQLGSTLACCQTLANHPAQRNMDRAGFQYRYTQYNVLTPRVRG